MNFFSEGSTNTFHDFLSENLFAINLNVHDMYVCMIPNDVMIFYARIEIYQKNIYNEIKLCVLCELINSF